MRSKIPPVDKAFRVPKVRRFRALPDYHRFIPLNAARRVLMLVCEPDGMAEFMGCGAAVEKAKIHGRFVQRNASAIGADIGPGAILWIEGDADLCIRSIVKIKLQVRDLRPLISLLASDILFRR